MMRRGTQLASGIAAVPVETGLTELRDARTTGAGNTVADGPVRRSVAIAVVDSALASVATFTVGLYAARYLSLAQLGGYGILFVATFVLSGMTVTQLYFVPIEAEYLHRPVLLQLAALRRSTCTGAFIAALIAVAVAGGSTVLIPELSWSERLALAGGAATLGLASPVQDHVRRVYHQAGRSARAMQISAVQLAAAVISLVGLSVLDVTPVLVPFTALTIANVTSATVGVVLAMGDAADARATPPAARAVLGRGALLVAATQSEQLGGFMGIAMLGNLSGAVAVGQYEAARQLAQPLFVLSAGLLAVLRPRAMTAAHTADWPSARRTTVLFAGLLVGAGIAGALTIGLSWPFNPLPAMFANAYDRDWMLFSLLLASSIAFITPVLGAQAIAARRERDLLRIGVTNQIVYVGVIVLLADPLGALALPLASAAHTVAWLLRVWPVLRAIYGRPEPRPALLAADGRH